jgi:uncharacterized protein (TIGR02266 family)
MSDDRKDQRVKVPTLKAKYKSATVDEFIDQYAGDISRGGIFIKTPKPSPIGTLLKIEIQLKDGAPVISAVGRVVWRREQPEGGQAAGMGIKFIKLEPESVPIVERIVERKAPGEGPHFDEVETAAPAAGETNSEFFGQTNPQAEMPAEQDRTMMRQMSAFLGEALRGAKEEPKPADAPKKPAPKSTMIGMPAMNPLMAKPAEPASKPAETPKSPEPAKETPKPAEPVGLAKPAEPAAKPVPKGTLVGMAPVLPASEPAKPEPAKETPKAEPKKAELKPAAKISAMLDDAFGDENVEAATAVTSKDALDKALAAAAEKADEFEGEPTSVADKGELDRLLGKSTAEEPKKAEPKPEPKPEPEAKKEEPKPEPEAKKDEPKLEPKKDEPKPEPKPEPTPPTTSSALDAATAAASAAKKDEPKKDEPKKDEPKAAAPKKEEPAEEKKSPVGLIAIVVLLLAGAAGAYVMLNKSGQTPTTPGSGGSAIEAPEAGVAEAPAPTPAVVEDAAPAAEPPATPEASDAAAAPAAEPVADASPAAEAPTPTPTPTPAVTPTPRPASTGDAGARPRPRPAPTPAAAPSAGTGAAAGSGSAGSGSSGSGGSGSGGSGSGSSGSGSSGSGSAGSGSSGSGSAGGSESVPTNPI